VETDACNFQHPPEAEARFFIASDLRLQGCDLTERLGEAIFGHILGMTAIMSVSAHSKLDNSRVLSLKVLVAECARLPLGFAPFRTWTAPGILEALIPGRMQSHAGTAEVPR
jgi:hypothetical protein